MVLGLLTFAIFIFSVFFGFYGYFLEKNSKVNKYFLLSCLSYSIWNLGYTFIFLENNINNIKLWYRISSIGWTLLPTFTLLFFLELTKVKFSKNKIIKIIIIIPGLISLYLGLSGKILASDFIKLNIGWYEIIEYNSLWNILYPLYAFLYSIFGYYLVILWYKNTKKIRERKQAFIILITGIISIVMSFPLNLVFPVMGIKIPCLGHIFAGFWTIGFVIAIVRYRFMTLNPELVASTIFSEMTDVMILLNDDFEIIKTNKYFEKITGYLQDEVLYKKIFNFIEGLENKLISNNKNLHPKGKILTKEEMYFIGKNNNKIPLSVTLFSVEDNAQDIIGYVLFGQDLTFLKKLETTLNEKEIIEKELIETNKILQLERMSLKKRNKEVEMELVLARQIQLQHIPSTPPSNFISYMYIPMESVGGDFFDFIKFDDNKIGIFISDVSGHGISAAYITSMIKTSLQQNNELLESPGYFLDYLNNLLYGRSGGNFITAFYCIIDFNNLTIKYSNAGHNLPYIITNYGVEEIKPKKNFLPLAIFSRDELIELDRTYSDETFQLLNNSKIFLYTDGLSDAVNLYDLGNKDQITFADKYFPMIFKNNSHLSSKELVNKIYETLIEFRGHNVFDDDICMICVEV